MPSWMTWCKGTMEWVFHEKSSESRYHLENQHGLENAPFVDIVVHLQNYLSEPDYSFDSTSFHCRKQFQKPPPRKPKTESFEKGCSPLNEWFSSASPSFSLNKAAEKKKTKKKKKKTHHCRAPPFWKSMPVIATSVGRFYIFHHGWRHRDWLRISKWLVQLLIIYWLKQHPNIEIPSRELAHPTWGKSSSKVPW